MNVVDLATNGTFKIYGEPEIVSAAWAPDGSKVLVSSSAPHERDIMKRVLRTVNTDGSNVKDIHIVTCITNMTLCGSWGQYETLWAPDAKKIVVRELSDVIGLNLRNADGQGVQTLVSSPLVGTRALATDFPRFWSVDGAWILVVSADTGHTKYSLEVNGTRRMPVSSLGGIKVYDERYYPWKVMDAPTTCRSFEYFNCP